MRTARDQPVHHGSAVHTDTWKTEGLKQAWTTTASTWPSAGRGRDEERSRAVADQFEADIIWMSEHEMLPGRSYLLKIGAQTVGATVAQPK